jgi:site-specific DNA recombinase
MPARSCWRLFDRALSGLSLDEEVLAWLTKALRISHEDAKRFHDDAIARLETEYKVLQARIDGMYLDKLDSRITAAFFDRKATEWRRQQSGILRSFEDHQQANQTYLEDGG